MNDFEANDNFLLNNDPIFKRGSSGVNHGVSEISDSTCVDISSTSGKIDIGKTGNHLLVYKNTQYDKLPDNQKDDLQEHSKQKNSKKVDQYGRNQENGKGRENGKQ